jgi:SAM-dependent methyltransferase
MGAPPPGDDVYRRPLRDALGCVAVGPGWHCADVGAGVGDVTLALADLVGPTGRVYGVDRSATACDELAKRAAEAGASQVVPLVQAAEDLELPEQVDLAYCRFLLMHVAEPYAVWSRLVAATRKGGFVLAQEPITSGGRVGGVALSMPDVPHPDVGALLPRYAIGTGCTIVAAWAEAPAGAGPGPVAAYLADLTGVDPGDDPIVLPTLVTVVARKPETP